MAFFGYDPYDYYYAAPPVNYAYPYYHRQQQPAPARSAGGFFPAAEPLAVRPRQAPTVEAVNPKPRARTVSIPVHFIGSDPEPTMALPKRRSPSAEEACTRVQAGARGFLARKAVRALRAVEREADEVAGKVAREQEALRGDARARVAVGEALMRLLLRLDAVRGAREYRRRVTKRVLALQDAVDALEPRTEPVAVTEVTEATVDEMPEEIEMASEHTDAAEHSGENEAEAEEPRPAAAEEPESEVTQAAAEQGDLAPEVQVAAENSAEMEETAPAEAVPKMEVDENRAAGEHCETEQAPDGANQGGVTLGNVNDEEGECQMVTEEPEPAMETEASAEPSRKEPAGEIRKAEEAAGDGGVDTKKVMEMVAALCERSAQQCAVIGALAKRVDALERAVRRVEDSERRRRRAKKLKKEGRGSNHNKCYLD